MSSLKSSAAFLRSLSEQRGAIERATEALRSDVIAALKDDAVLFSAVSARAKTVDSIRGKLLKKSYLKPLRDMTDLIGVRVVVVRSSQIDRAVASLQKRLQVIKSKSVDKRTSLQLREFGYRSVHLICRIPHRIRDASGFQSGCPSTFEVQIRSLLEHSWAEIEHGVVYKAGAQLPSDLRRRFASLAGALEVVEREFEQLAIQSNLLVEKEKQEMTGQGYGRRAVDVPRLIAIVETYNPSGEPMRVSDSVGRAVAPALLSRIVDALRACRIRTTGALANELVSADFRRCVSRFASHEVIDAAEVSHLAICILLVGSKKRAMIDVFFPEYACSPSVMATFGTERK